MFDISAMPEKETPVQEMHLLFRGFSVDVVFLLCIISSRNNNNISQRGDNMRTLRQLRQVAELSQTDAARAIGVSLGAYRLWELGAGKPNDKNLNGLKKLFGEDVLQIFDY